MPNPPVKWSVPALNDFRRQIAYHKEFQLLSPPPPTFAEAPRRYLLTVAHLDQQPSNQDRSNLKTLCTVCHLRFDSQFRAKQKRLKAEFYGQLSIEAPWEEGFQLSLLPNQVSPFSLPRQGDAPVEGRILP